MILSGSTSAITSEQGLPPPSEQKQENIEGGGNSSGDCGGDHGKYPEKYRFGILLGMLTIATMVDADGVVAENRAGSATGGSGRKHGDGVGRTGKSSTIFNEKLQQYVAGRRMLCTNGVSTSFGKSVTLKASPQEARIKNAKPAVPASQEGAVT